VTVEVLATSQNSKNTMRIEYTVEEIQQKKLETKQVIDLTIFADKVRPQSPLFSQLKKQFS
jgi:hypothetical protein